MLDDDNIQTNVTETSKKIESVRNGLPETTNKSNYRETNLEKPFISTSQFEIYWFWNSMIKSRLFQNFAQFISNCKSVYSISWFVIVDEMIILGRWASKYMCQKKSKKYGIKVMWLINSKPSYLLNVYIIYSRKGSDRIGVREEEKPSVFRRNQWFVLANLFKGWTEILRLINFPLWKFLKHCQKGTWHIVGIMKKDKKAISVEFLPGSEKPVLSSQIRCPF